MVYKNRAIPLITAVIIVALAGFYIRDYFFIVRGISIEAVPGSLFPGDTSTITVRFLNDAGKTVPFANRRVDFEIFEGGEHAALEDAHAQGTIFLHAVSPGIIVVHVHVQGFMLPFEKTVRCTLPIG